MDGNFKEAKSQAATPEDQRSFKELDELNVELIALEQEMMGLAASDPQKARQIFSGKYAELHGSFKRTLDEYVERTTKAVEGSKEKALARARGATRFGSLQSSQLSLASR